MRKETLEMAIMNKANILGMDNKVVDCDRGKITTHELVLEMVEKLKDDMIRLNKKKSIIPRPVHQITMELGRSILNGLSENLKELSNVE
jgi:hypothetical protein